MEATGSKNQKFSAGTPMEDSLRPFIRMPKTVPSHQNLSPLEEWNNVCDRFVVFLDTEKQPKTIPK